MPICDYCSGLSGFHDRNFTRSGGSICDRCIELHGHPDEPGSPTPAKPTPEARAAANRQAILDAARAHLVVMYIDKNPPPSDDPEAPAPRPPEIVLLQYALKLFALSAHSLQDAARRAAKEFPEAAEVLDNGCPFGEDLHELSLEIRSWTDRARLLLETLRY